MRQIFPSPSSPDRIPCAVEEADFVAALGRSKRTLYKVAYLYCPDIEERQDLLQEMVFQLWRAFPQFGGRSSEVTWAYRVALNVAISWGRRDRRRIRETLPLETALNVADADRAFEADAEKSRTLRGLVDGLDAYSRSLVALYLDGFDHGEIAEILGTSASNVGTRLTRIRRRLKSQFERDQRRPT